MRKSVREVLGRAVAVLFCVAGVPVLVLILIRVLFGASITDYHPVINDEAAYWHQALTFSRVGFHGGYYTVDEVTNASGVTPFGPHGPGFAMVYGTFGAMFGWYRHSVVVLNLCAIALAAIVWVWLARLSLARLFLSGVLLATFWHTVFWAPTGMQEALHHAGAIVMAALFAATLDPSPRPWTRTSGWIVIAVLSFIRPSWLILIPIWAVATSRRSSRVVMLATVSASVVLIAAILFAYTRTAAPYGDGFFFLRALSLSLGVRAIGDNVLSNLHRMSVPGQYQAIEILQRYQYVALLVTVTSAALVMWKRRRPQIDGPEAHFGVAAIAMGTALAAMLMLYEFAAFAEHRVLSAFLLFGALVCLRAPGWIGPLVGAGLIASNVLAAHTMLQNFEAGRRDNFLWDRQGLIDLQNAIVGKITYQPGASRWCNTLLTSQYPPHMIAIPAGIGLSVVVKPEAMAHGPRSRYLLLDEQMQARFREPLHLEPTATLPYGTLYVNRDADCK